MHRQAVVSRDGGSLFQRLQRKYPAAALVVGVLHREHASGCVVDIHRMDGLGDFRAREKTAGPQSFDLDAPQRCTRSAFVKQDVRVVADQHRVSGASRRCDGRLVAHRSRGDKEGGFFAREFRGHLLQPIDGRIFSVNVISDLG